MKEYSIGCHFFIHSSCNDDTSSTAVWLAALLWIWRAVVPAVLLHVHFVMWAVGETRGESLWSDTDSMSVIHLHSLIFKLFSIPWNSHSRLPRWCMSNLLRFVMNNFAKVISTSSKFSHSFLYHCLLSILQSLWLCWPLLILTVFIWVEISGQFGWPLTS